VKETSAERGAKGSPIEESPGEGLSVRITCDPEKEQDGLTEFAPTWGLDPNDSMMEEAL